MEKYRCDDQVFEVDYVVSHIEDSDFQEWLKKESNNTAFIIINSRSLLKYDG